MILAGAVVVIFGFVFTYIALDLRKKAVIKDDWRDVILAFCFALAFLGTGIFLIGGKEGLKLDLNFVLLIIMAVLGLFAFVFSSLMLGLGIHELLQPAKSRNLVAARNMVGIGGIFFPIGLCLLVLGVATLLHL